MYSQAGVEYLFTMAGLVAIVQIFPGRGNTWRPQQPFLARGRWSHKFAFSGISCGTQDLSDSSSRSSSAMCSSAPLATTVSALSVRNSGKSPDL